MSTIKVTTIIPRGYDTFCLYCITHHIKELYKTILNIKTNFLLVVSCTYIHCLIRILVSVYTRTREFRIFIGTTGSTVGPEVSG